MNLYYLYIEGIDEKEIKMLTKDITPPTGQQIVPYKPSIIQKAKDAKVGALVEAREINEKKVEESKQGRQSTRPLHKPL